MSLEDLPACAALTCDHGIGVSACEAGASFGAVHVFGVECDWPLTPATGVLGISAASVCSAACPRRTACSASTRRQQRVVRGSSCVLLGGTDCRATLVGQIRSPV